MNYDIKFVLKLISELLGIPVRLYENDKKVYYYSLVELPIDPIVIDENLILSKKDKIGYILDDCFFYYCYLNINVEKKIVVGPISNDDNRQFLKLCALKLSLSVKDIDAFIDSMSLLSSISYQTALEMLTLVSYFLTEEKTNWRTLFVQEAKKAIKEDKKEQSEKTSHNSYQIEKEILSIVRKGDVDAIDAFIDALPFFSSGKLSYDAIRQIKNTFIVTATLISRAAIEEGMNVDDALSLSDFYIQKLDTLQSDKEISNLIYRMVREYTMKVKEIKELTPLAYQIKRYVLSHLDESIAIEEIAEELKIPKSTLFRRFKKEMPCSISDYINEVKIENSKELLLSGSSFSSIAYCLGYSSQSHFSNMFKKVTSMTPSQFKEGKRI